MNTDANGDNIDALYNSSARAEAGTSITELVIATAAGHVWGSAVGSRLRLAKSLQPERRQEKKAAATLHADMHTASINNVHGRVASNRRGSSVVQRPRAPLLPLIVSDMRGRARVRVAFGGLPWGLEEKGFATCERPTTRYSC